MLSQIYKKYLRTAILAFGLVGVHSAQASFVMMLDDPNDNAAATYIYDLSSGDFNPATGAITFFGSIGSFVVNVVTGVSKPLTGPSALSLNSINVTGNSAGTLLLGLSDTDFTNSNMGNFLTSSGGTTQGSVKFNYLYGATNSEFGGNSLASYNFSSSSLNNAFRSDIVTPILSSAPFSLSLLAEINHTAANQVTSFNSAIVPTPAPLPAALWMFLSALTGGYLFARKNKTSA